MNIFCRLFGHTWIHIAEDPKIRWSHNKAGTLLEPVAEGEPRFYEVCQRCSERREWSAGTKASAKGATS